VAVTPPVHTLNMPTALLVALVAAAVLALAYAVGTRAARLGGQAADERVTVALEHQVAQLEARLGLEREHTVRSAADMAARLAGEKLGDTMVSGTNLLAMRSESFDQRVEGLMTQVERLGDVVTRLQRDGASQHSEVLTGLRAAQTSTKELAQTTGALREALASPKARGQWGERMADDVLRHAGMVEGISYRKQTAITGGSIPDVTFLMPGGRVLHMDVKFPVDNYLRHLEATTDAERDTHAKAFLRDVRNRVKEIASRTGYIDADTTLDQVLLFIPNESVWAFIHERDAQLIDIALQQKVVLCSPVSLFAVLAVIRQAVEQTQLARTSDEILQCLAGFGKEWTKFSESLDKVVTHFDRAQRGLEDVTGTRRRQLERQLDRVEALRVARGLPELELPATRAERGDGDEEARRRSTGDVRLWDVPEAG
jgi:DNA recombination protein RmuC